MLSPAQSKCLTDAVTVAVAVVLLTAEADGWTAAERGGTEGRRGSNLSRVSQPSEHLALFSAQCSVQLRAD